MQVSKKGVPQSRGGSVNRKTDIFKTETDTDFDILKTVKYRIPTKNN